MLAGFNACYDSAGRCPDTSRGRGLPNEALSAMTLVRPFRFPRLDAAQALLRHELGVVVLTGRETGFYIEVRRQPLPYGRCRHVPAPVVVQAEDDLARLRVGGKEMLLLLYTGNR